MMLSMMLIMMKRIDDYDYDYDYEDDDDMTMIMLLIMMMSIIMRLIMVKWTIRMMMARVIVMFCSAVPCMHVLVACVVRVMCVSIWAHCMHGLSSMIPCLFKL